MGVQNERSDREFNTDPVWELAVSSVTSSCLVLRGAALKRAAGAKAQPTARPAALKCEHVAPKREMAIFQFTSESGRLTSIFIGCSLVSHYV